MKVDLAEVPCAGFADHEIDFPALFSRLGQTQHDLLETMIEEAVTAESDPGAGRFCSITIVGHSDRVDLVGASSEQKRADELQMSTLRAESAQAWFFTQIFDRLKAEGAVAPVDMASLQNVELNTVPCGSADLVQPTPTDENQRQQNRRVHFIGTMFTPGEKNP